MPSDAVVRARPARWPLRLPDDVPAEDVAALRAAVSEAAAASDYGWGHTIDFGPFREEGLLSARFLDFVGALDEWGWWPERLDGLTTADIGAFTGGVSAIMAHRGAAKVFAVDEMPGHVRQAQVVADAFRLKAVEPVQASLYDVPQRLGHGSLDVILCGGVLYHCSDMLVAMIALQEALRPGGVLLLETNAVRDVENSYANFGRFVAGMWWKPTGACLVDLCRFAGFDEPDVRFYHSGRALVRATKPADARVRFRRGMNWRFDDVHDDEERGMDPGQLAPAPLAAAVAPATPAGDRVSEMTSRDLLGVLARRGARSARRRVRRVLRR